MVIAAQTLEKHENRIELMRPSNVDPFKEIEMLNSLVLSETQQFFERVTGAATLPDDEQSDELNSDRTNEQSGD